MKEKIAQQDEGEFNKSKLWILAELTKLRQICCSPSLCFENYRGESAKAESCMQLIQSAIDGGHRMLLFSQFTSMLALLQAALEKEGIPYYIITGETSKQKRQELVKQFNSDTTPVFLISLKAGGVGLNLTGADVVIHYDPGGIRLSRIRPLTVPTVSDRQRKLPCTSSSPAIPLKKRSRSSRKQSRIWQSRSSAVIWDS